MVVRLEAEADRSCKGAALYRLQQDKQLPTVLCLNARRGSLPHEANWNGRNEMKKAGTWITTSWRDPLSVGSVQGLVQSIICVSLHHGDWHPRFCT
jgi:hypothetical protein